MHKLTKFMIVVAAGLTCGLIIGLIKQWRRKTA
ncbi:hypothetical protein MTATph1_CDS0232 [Moorella phage MTATph1]